MTEKNKKTKPTKVEIKVEPKQNQRPAYSGIVDRPDDYEVKEIQNKSSKEVEILGKIKIARKFALLIKMGFKKYEVRKLIKGYVEGYYMLVDVETGKDLFLIHMKPYAVNPRWTVYESGNRGFSYKNYAHVIDDMTWTWVKKNYIKKKFDFVVYDVSIPEVA